MEEFFKNHASSEVLTHFINKWAARAFIAWIISGLLFRFTATEFLISLLPLFTFVIWMIRAEWKYYKRWLTLQEKKKGSKGLK